MSHNTLPAPPPMRAPLDTLTDEEFADALASEAETLPRIELASRPSAPNTNVVGEVDHSRAGSGVKVTEFNLSKNAAAQLKVDASKLQNVR